MDNPQTGQPLMNRRMIVRTAREYLGSLIKALLGRCWRYLAGLKRRGNGEEPLSPKG
jgi:hypothetical protein